MRNLIRKSTAVLLCHLLALLPIFGGATPREQQAPVRSVQTLTLREYLQKPYLDLFDLAPRLEFSAGEIESQRNALKERQGYLCGPFQGPFQAVRQPD